MLVAINSDAHSTFELDQLRFGVGQARRGWLEKKDVLNTRSAQGAARSASRPSAAAIELEEGKAEGDSLRTAGQAVRSLQAHASLTCTPLACPRGTAMRLDFPSTALISYALPSGRSVTCTTPTISSRIPQATRPSPRCWRSTASAAACCKAGSARRQLAFLGLPLDSAARAAASRAAIAFKAVPVAADDAVHVPEGYVAEVLVRVGRSRVGRSRLRAGCQQQRRRPGATGGHASRRHALLPAAGRSRRAQPRTAGGQPRVRRRRAAASGRHANLERSRRCASARLPTACR